MHFRLHDENVNAAARLDDSCSSGQSRPRPRAAVPLAVSAWVPPGSVTDVSVPVAEAVA